MKNSSAFDDLSRDMGPVAQGVRSAEEEPAYPYFIKKSDAWLIPKAGLSLRRDFEDGGEFIREEIKHLWLEEKPTEFTLLGERDYIPGDVALLLLAYSTEKDKLSKLIINGNCYDTEDLWTASGFNKFDKNFPRPTKKSRKEDDLPKKTKTTESEELVTLVSDMLEERGHRWKFIFPEGTKETFEFLYSKEGFDLITSGKCKLTSLIVGGNKTLTLDNLKEARKFAISKNPKLNHLDGDNSDLMLNLVEEYLFIR